MKYLLLLVLVLTGCGGGSESGNPSVPPGPTPVPTCKSLYSEWTSTTDLESHDFTNLTLGNVVQEYEYSASNGTTCGYVSNPNHNLSAELIVWPTPVPFDYALQMEYSLAMGGVCATYLVPGSAGDRDQIAFVTLGCDELEICATYSGGNLSNCKVFE